jgi:hypothetical protein
MAEDGEDRSWKRRELNRQGDAKKRKKLKKVKRKVKKLEEDYQTA